MRSIRNNTIEVEVVWTFENGRQDVTDEWVRYVRSLMDEGYDYVVNSYGTVMVVNRNGTDYITMHKGEPNA